MRIVLLGAPGAGKGTQAVTMSRDLGLAHIASGDLFREAARQGNELGILVKAYMERGVLVPDEVTVRVVLERVSAADCERGFILDGFPRTLEQAKALDAALSRRGIAVDCALHLKVEPGELLGRLGGRWTCRNCQAVYHEVSSPPKATGRCDRCGGALYQREDDRPETVRKRLEVYLAQTAPLIDYYRQSGKLVEVNGQQDIKAVRRDAMAALGTPGCG